MDEFLDPLLSTSSWTNISSPDNSSWLGSDASQTTVTDSLQTYRQDEQEQKFKGCMTPSSQMLRDMNFHETITHNGNTSIFAINDLKCSLNGSFYSFENQLQQNMSIHSSTLHQPENGILDQSLSLPRVTENAGAERQYGVGLGSTGNNSSEPSGFSQRSETSLLWASSHSGATCLGINQINFQQFGLHGEFVKSDMDIFGKRCASGELLRSSISPVLGNGQKELHKISSTASAVEMNVAQNNHLEFNDQLSQYSKGNSAEHNVNSSTTTRIQPPQGSTNFHGSVPKPRVRARRGQATDPHSIAERLRREKISERMKNLQELVPNANKTDKASMLDEIIEYVKFLQLQVKVLSMSRVGAAGAVVPLITDIKAENADSLLISTPTGVEGTDSCDSQENLPFEQEVAKLMESDVTTAIQLLQSKGMCLMPTALADAISIRKGSLAATPTGKKNAENSPVGSKSNNLKLKEKDMKQ